MMKLKHNFKKGMALVLSLVMAAGLVPAMSGGANTVQAATGSGTEPSVTAYATKDQLMTAFTPDANGTATTIGRLVFGKNSSGNAQEWYILGKDSGVSGDNNTIIFATSPIATGRKFEDDWQNNKTEQSLWSDCNYNGTSITEAYPNHYGASDLRGELQSMASNTSYFTTAEQGLMNATTVTTKDTKNNSVTYTTTDKLYALQGDYNAQYLWAGSSDSTVLAMSSFWNSGSQFWLRSPYVTSDSCALLANPGGYVLYFRVTYEPAVQPASNLDLSSVLFASAAMAASSDTAESGTITSDKAMTLRLDGTGKNIGTVEYSATTGDINVVRGATSQPVSLVVQGNDGTQDWFYSKQITGTETINASNIKSALRMTTDIDLSACKIWLEITEDNVSYAVNTEDEIEKINTTYVTRDELMTAFKPEADGTATNYGKLVFGKNISDEAQEWYILGKDKGVLGDNTIIFAASPIVYSTQFESSGSNKNDVSLWSDCNYGGVSVTEVFANHYGASNLRGELKTMAKNTSYFTAAEQDLMNNTSVTTKDTKNRNNYTTTDKLYALAADGYRSSTIKAGSDNSTVLAMSNYWNSGTTFWLRSPRDDFADAALLTSSGSWVNYNEVYYGGAVQPASNLDLSSVLFASAATAASSDTAVAKTIASEAAMNLRLNGTGKDIGTVTYSTTTGDIKAMKGSTSQPVSLVVQGNDGTNDWYYSKQITGTETINVSAIEAESNTPASINLSACKIWLEITEDNVTYAVNATETVVSEISSVAITDIATPVSNTALDAEASCVTEGVSSTTPQITWTPSDSTAGYNTSYTASITLTAATDYEFTDSTTATVLGNNATSITKNTDGTLTVTYAFPATAKDKLTSITAPQAITVANGTAYDAMNLPATVNIVTEGNTASSAQVTWDTTTPASGSYDPAVLTQQTVTLNGTVDCPDSIDANGVSLTTTITITISAAGIVGAPTANPTAGTYSENQSVALTPSTVGATIYYTTDGSEPTITGGVTGGTTQQYTAPIAVTGTEGQSSTTTIKAIAVKNGMQDSSVETFTYTIQIPVAKYTVTVTNGSGTGQYAQGETVTIIAGAAPSGQQFKEWEVVSGTITLASSTSETTTFTMPTEAVSVKANYEAISVTGYTITATAGANGSITPSGAVGVAAGGSQTFTISPSSGYVIDTLKVDGLEVTATTSYTFSDVKANHTIEVTFKQESQTPDVTAPSITTQPGNATVKAGETATFTIAASGTDLTYLWQIDRNDGNGWVNIDGATATSYTTSTVDISCNGFKYQCVVRNSAGTDTSNTAVLTVTENTTPAPGSVDYEILDGANTSWEQNSDGSLSIRGSGAISKFVGVKVDGNLVDVRNYTVKEGSTIVTLKADYLNTLSVGNHTFEIIWTDGTASTRFTVSKSDSGSAEPKDNDGNNGKNDNTNNTPATALEDKNSNGTSGSQTDDNQQITAPKTGDNSHTVLWISLLGVSLAGLLSMIYVRKKKENE